MFNVYHNLRQFMDWAKGSFIETENFSNCSPSGSAQYILKHPVIRIKKRKDFEKIKKENLWSLF